MAQKIRIQSSTPINGLDAANKNYIDSRLIGRGFDFTSDTSFTNEINAYITIPFDVPVSTTYKYYYFVVSGKILSQFPVHSYSPHTYTGFVIKFYIYANENNSYEPYVSTGEIRFTGIELNNELLTLISPKCGARYDVNNKQIIIAPIANDSYSSANVFRILAPPYASTMGTIKNMMVLDYVYLEPSDSIEYQDLLPVTAVSFLPNIMNTGAGVYSTGPLLELVNSVTRLSNFQSTNVGFRIDQNGYSSHYSPAFFSNTRFQIMVSTTTTDESLIIMGTYVSANAVGNKKYIIDQYYYKSNTKRDINIVVDTEGQLCVYNSDGINGLFSTTANIVLNYTEPQNRLNVTITPLTTIPSGVFTPAINNYSVFESNELVPVTAVANQRLGYAFNLFPTVDNISGSFFATAFNMDLFTDKPIDYPVNTPCTFTTTRCVDGSVDNITIICTTAVGVPRTWYGTLQKSATGATSVQWNEELVTVDYLKNNIHSIQQPESFTYTDTNTFRLNNVPAFIVDIKVFQNTGNSILSDADYTLNGQNLTINNPTLISGDTIRVVYAINH